MLRSPGMSLDVGPTSTTSAGSSALEDGHMQAARFAFLQTLMEEGYLGLSDAVALFKGLTGKTQGGGVGAWCNASWNP